MADTTPITITAKDDLTGYQIWLRVKHEDDGWSEWFICSKNAPYSFTFIQEAAGNCEIQYCSEDGVWNFEDIKSKSFYVNTKPMIPEIVDGTHNGIIYKDYSYTLNAWDPDENEQLQYRIDWDGNGWSDWQDFDKEYNNDGKTKAKKTLSHRWTSPYNGKIKVQSRDSFGSLSEVFDDYDVNMERNDAPELSEGEVSPETGTTSTSFTYKVKYTDREGDAPISSLVYIDEFGYTMNLVSGDYKKGAIYTYETPLTRGDHDYYFQFIGSNGWTARFPTHGSISGPHVEPENNLPPNKPDKPSGPSIAAYGGTADFKTKSTDPENDKLYYMFIFKGWKGLSIHGQPVGRTPFFADSGYYGPYKSGEKITINLDIPDEGVIDDKWEVYVIAKDEWGAISEISDFTTFITTHSPDAPSIKGSSEGTAGKSYTFNVTATEPDEENILYYFDWGDGTNSGWLGPYPSGTMIEKSHSWKAGSWTIKVKAKDIHDIESEWGTLKITISKNRANYQAYQHFFQKLIKHFPILLNLMHLPIFERISKLI